jgi:chaperonin GroES
MKASTKVRPLHDRLLVRRLEPKETARGGIIIPDTAKERKRLPVDVEVGDRILFGKYSGTEIEMDGEEVLVVREDEVLAIVD